MGLTNVYFWSAIQKCARWNAQDWLIRGHTNVRNGDLDWLSSSDQNVCWFEIVMNNLEAVELSKSTCCLIQECYDL
jgi:hypothetical protein